MRFLKHEDFASAVGESFDLIFSDGTVSLTLEEVTELPGYPREGGAFRLQFKGPVEPQLPQGCYLFRRLGEEDEIFIVPIAAKPGGVEYEAIFA